jgi:hypothetical protein
VFEFSQLNQHRLGLSCLIQWVLIHYYHYLFDAQNLSDFADREPREADFHVLLTFPSSSEHTIAFWHSKLFQVLLVPSLTQQWS